MLSLNTTLHRDARLRADGRKPTEDSGSEIRRANRHIGAAPAAAVDEGANMRRLETAAIDFVEGNASTVVSASSLSPQLARCLPIPSPTAGSANSTENR